MSTGISNFAYRLRLPYLRWYASVRADFPLCENLTRYSFL